ncbi:MULTISPECIES: hypothetical protein [unclassified Pseudomonas]|uniref:hypothetical protein n=1 Tax=unclassified Pseudomonas TaxID=196821 RepID=UPI0035C112CC
MSGFMIDVSTCSPEIRVAILFVPFSMAIVGLAITAHIAATSHFEVLRAALQNSEGFQEDVRANGALTVRFRVLIVSGASVLLLWPEWAIRKGLLDPVDNQNFPGYLRRRIKISFWLEVPSFILLVVIGYGFKFK